MVQYYISNSSKPLPPVLQNVVEDGAKTTYLIWNEVNMNEILYEFIC